MASTILTKEQMVQIMGQDEYNAMIKETDKLIVERKLTADYAKSKIPDIQDAEKAYLGLLESFKADNPSLKMSLYQEGKFAQALLQDGYDSNLIKQAIVAHSPLANEPGKFSMGYANNVITKSEAVIDRINTIKNWVETPNSANVITEKQLIENDYIILAQQHLQEPANKITPAVDIEIAGKLLHKWEEIENVGHAIQEVSPVAQEAGRNPEGYEKFIKMRLQERQQKHDDRLKNLEAKYEKTAHEYIRQIETWEKANPDYDFESYQDGRIAMDMLQKGHERENVQRALSEISPVAAKLNEERGVEANKYGASVAFHAAEEIKRLHELSSLPEPDGKSLSDYLRDNEAGSSAEKAYLYALKHYTDKYPGEKLNLSTDIQVAKSIAPQFSQEEIQKAVLEKSPIAIQTGRYTERYVEHVTSKAMQLHEYSRRTEKIREFVPDNRFKHRPSQEYLRQAKALQNKGVPTDKRDETIAKAMLAKDFSSTTVAKTVAKYSPQFVKKEDLLTVKNLVKEIAKSPEIKKTLAHQISR